MKLTPELREFISNHSDDDTNLLALQADKYPDIDIKEAIQQIKGQQIAKIKIPSWYKTEDIIYPKHLSMEQCSSEYTARYKARIYTAESMVDLTGGFGVDCAFLSKSFKKITYVEQQEELSKIAGHNFNVLNLDIQVQQNDAVDYLKNMQSVDLVYIDPARRSTSGSKTVLIEDCTPNIIDLDDLLSAKSKRTMIKLSPMLDISLVLKSIKNISEVHVISHQNECKELIFIKNNETKTKSVALHCINIHNTETDEFVFYKEIEEEIKADYADEIGKYIYEPNSSILKAGAYKSITLNFAIKKLHPNSHLYTSDELVESFQGRIFKVETVSSLNKKDLKKNMSNIKHANISTRNFPLTPQELKNRLKIKDGGNTYIFGTTSADEKKILIVAAKV